MEDTKYYQPEITEFHVGFECECNDEETGFEPITICAEDLKNKLDEEYNFQEVGSIHPEYRVKCLDRDDIESFGFKCICTNTTYKYVKDNPDQILLIDKRQYFGKDG